MFCRRTLIGVVGEAFGEVTGTLSLLLDLSALTFEISEGGTVTDLLGTSEIPVTLTIDPGTPWEYQDPDPNSSTVDPESELEIDTGDVTTFALSGEVELLGELILFSATREDMTTLNTVTAHVVNAGGFPPRAEALSTALSEFWLTSLVSTSDLRTQGELVASDFAEVQGLSLTLRASIRFNGPEIHYVPEPSSDALRLWAIAMLAALIWLRRQSDRKRARGSQR
jgi:hypothetical protein